jgi:hypothetical protein
MERWRV